MAAAAGTVGLAATAGTTAQAAPQVVASPCIMTPGTLMPGTLMPGKVAGADATIVHGAAAHGPLAARAMGWVMPGRSTGAVAATGAGTTAHAHPAPGAHAGPIRSPGMITPGALCQGGTGIAGAGATAAATPGSAGPCVGVGAVGAKAPCMRAQARGAPGGSAEASAAGNSMPCALGIAATPPGIGAPGIGPTGTASMTPGHVELGMTIGLLMPMGTGTIRAAAGAPAAVAAAIAIGAVKALATACSGAGADEPHIASEENIGALKGALAFGRKASTARRASKPGLQSSLHELLQDELEGHSCSAELPSPTSVAGGSDSGWPRRCCGGRCCCLCCCCLAVWHTWRRRPNASLHDVFRTSGLPRCGFPVSVESAESVHARSSCEPLVSPVASAGEEAGSKAKLRSSS
mmetsp:Transcript_7479/g.21293  ORF Transcript_7479/g.21293 Transcript_7479/m.21293 type:complete len:406 (-) Transcript_7479:282-1499(-)